MRETRLINKIDEILKTKTPSLKDSWKITLIKDLIDRWRLE